MYLQRFWKFFYINKYRNVLIVRIYLYNIIMTLYILLYIDYNGVEEIVANPFSLYIESVLLF